MAIYNWASKLIRDWFVFGLLRSVIGWLWLKTRATFSTNRGFVTSVFPRFRQFRYFYFKLFIGSQRYLVQAVVITLGLVLRHLVFGFVLHRVGDDFSKPFRGSYKTYIKKPYEEKLQNLSPWKHRKWINMSKCRLFYENNLIAFCKIKLFFNIWWLPATKTKYTIL